MAAAETQIATATSVLAYQPLPEADSIRLLLLEPASSENTELRCQIVQTTLSNCKQEIIDHYTALSYVWGDASKVRSIFVNDCPRDVTVNLYSALLNLRDEKRILRLWVDALCINQSNHEEKGQQIRLMGQIYATADHTVIYLGPWQPGADIHLEEVISDNKNGRQSLPLPIDSKILKIILRSEWFQRVWVFQELIFSRDPWVQYGRYRWTWDHLQNSVKEQGISGSLSDLNRSSRGSESSVPLRERVRLGYESISEMHLARVMHLNRSSRGAESSEPPRTHMHERVRPYHFRETHHEETGPKEKVAMLNLLKARRGLGVTDPRDMLYAHVGFASDGQDVNVDYTKTCAQVYEDFARHLMKSLPAYDLLLLVGNHESPTRVKGLGSWAPDWTIPSRTPFANTQGLFEDKLFKPTPIEIPSLPSPSIPTPSSKSGKISSLAKRFKEGLKGENVHQNIMKTYHGPFLKEHMSVDIHQNLHTWIFNPTALVCIGYVSDKVVRCSARLGKAAPTLGSEPYRRDRIRENREQIELYNKFRSLVQDEILPTPVPSGVSRLDEQHFRYEELALPDRDNQGHKVMMLGPTVGFLYQCVKGGISKNIVEGAALARLLSGALAFVPTDAQVGDLIVDLPQTGRGNCGPYLCRQDIGMSRSDYPVLKERVISALTEIDTRFEEKDMPGFLEYIQLDLQSDLVISCKYLSTVSAKGCGGRNLEPVVFAFG
jgi:hypothetical protein